MDTGLGNKENAKFRDIYGVANDGRAGPTQLEDALARGRPRGRRRSSWVINTHLHFDHAGGNTARSGDGRPSSRSRTRPTWCRRASWASRPTPTSAPPPATSRPTSPRWRSANRFRLVNGEVAILPGIHLLPTPGHVPFHQSVLVTDGGEAACFLGDLVPTAAHLPAPWIMGYDLEPLVTLQSKKRLLTRAAQEHWQLVFEHDPAVARAFVAVDARHGYASEPVDTVPGGS